MASCDVFFLACVKRIQTHAWDPRPAFWGVAGRHMPLSPTTLPCPPSCQVLKRQGYDEGCDIWSLGILLYTMLAG